MPNFNSKTSTVGTDPAFYEYTKLIDFLKKSSIPNILSTGTAKVQRILPATKGFRLYP